MEKADFEWDSEKDRINQNKHGLSFALAQLAFLDENRVILEVWNIVLPKNDIIALAASQVEL